MIMVKKIYIAVFAACMVLIGCGQERSAYQMREMQSADFTSSKSSRDAEMLNEDTGSSRLDIHTGQEAAIRKLITSSHLRIRVENLDNSANRLSDIMHKYSVYASSVNIYENSRDYTLRVPVTHYAVFREELMEIGKILRFNETTEDVTLRYYDLESRLNTQRALISTFHSYLGKAQNIDEILSVESRIAQLQAEIDDVGRQFRLLNDLINYSTVDLELSGPMSAASQSKETVWEKIKDLAAGFGDYVSRVVLILLAIIIYGLPSIIILLLLYWLLLGKIGLLKKAVKLVSGKKNRKTTEK